MGVRYSFSSTSITITNTADTTNLANSTYLALLQGGSGTMRLNIAEVFLGGEAPSASSVTTTVLARDSTVATATVSGGRNAVLDASSTAPGTVAIVGNTTSGTVPQRSATLHLLHLSFNAYGGIVRWVARPGEEPSVVGNTASLGEVSLSGYGASGTSGPVSSHILYEVA
jgi:hypothetical protein